MVDETKVSRRELTKKIGLGIGFCCLAPRLSLASIATPEQVEGPFYPDKRQSDTDMDLSQIKGHDHEATGEKILVHGRVTNIYGQPLANAKVDVWQANHYGRYSHRADENPAPLDPDFQGWGIVHTDTDGRYRFKTIKPGAYPLSAMGGSGKRCRHIHFKVSHPEHVSLTTQMYFKGDPLIAQDLVISTLPKTQQHLLIASSRPDKASGLPLYQFDLCLATAPS